MLAVAGLAGAIVGRSIRPFVSALVLAAGLVAMLAINNAPTFLYQAANGANPEVARRHVWELDIIPLRPILLVTPVPGHRIPLLNDLNDLVLRSFSQNSEPFQYLGTIGAIGLVVAIGSLLVGRVRPGPSLPNEAGGLITVLAFLGAWGGLSVFIYWLAFPRASRVQLECPFTSNFLRWPHSFQRSSGVGSGSRIGSGIWPQWARSPA